MSFVICMPLTLTVLVMFNSPGGTTGVHNISFVKSVDSQLEELGVDPALSPILDLGYVSSTGECVSASDGSPSLPPLFEDMSVGLDLLSEVDSDVGIDSLLESSEDLQLLLGKTYATLVWYLLLGKGLEARWLSG